MLSLVLTSEHALMWSPEAWSLCSRSCGGGGRNFRIFFWFVCLWRKRNFQIKNQKLFSGDHLFAFACFWWFENICRGAAEETCLYDQAHRAQCHSRGCSLIKHPIDFQHEKFRFQRVSARRRDWGDRLESRSALWRIAQLGGISSLFVHIYNLRISWTWRYFLHFWLNPCPKTTITTTFAVITVIMSLFRRSPWNPCPRADCMSRDTGIGLILIIENWMTHFFLLMTGYNNTSYDGYHDTSYWL